MEQTIPEKKGSRRPYTEQQRQQKRRLIRRAILFCILLIPFLIWIQSLLFKKDVLPFDNNILIFALINVNVLLVLFVLFLVLRNLAELLFERKVNRLGNKLKTKLIASFLSLTLIPTILLFFVALQFVSTSMDYWFNASIEDSLTESLQLAQSLLRDKEDQVTQMNKGIADRLKNLDISSYTTETISKTLENILSFNPINGPDGLTLITNDKNLEIAVRGPLLRNMILPAIPASVIQEIREKKGQKTLIQEMKKGDLVRSIAEVQIGSNNLGKGILVTSLLVKNDQLARMTTISRGLEGYRQLKHFKEPFKFWLLIILLIVTLLIIFAAIWFGLYISRGITEPIEQLVLATRRVAEGDLEFKMEHESNDEMGLLVESFNKMTINLNSSNKRLAEAHRALQKSSQESEQRRRYTEIILQNVSAGVISLDETGQIITINRFAETLLNIDKTLFIGLNFNDVLPPYQAAIVQGFIDELHDTGKITVEQHIRLNVLGKNYSLLVNFTRLEDEEGEPLGFVLVFDNLTKLEKMQRVAAWREVARRIAHEIKNPLTPIQLSAQRLRRRYPEILAEQNSVFDKCTNTIITQVDELKRLVSEFSQFARMPKVQKSPNNLTQLVENTLILYKEAHKHITFNCIETKPIPVFSFDREQLKRCLINLIDNSVAVLSDGGTITTELSPDDEMENVFIRVADDGPGISKENKLKLFEPYFSTKKTGTGLGLAIVSTIISDHNGYIRVQDNEPTGSVFVIELPLANRENRNIS
ncbi:PAS domain-containing sensor histidine kinase [Desulfomarina profundi]|uniref:histidine kinase n=1 Tax=Desulfomarina profundi TaxID=2772557 RepID=A0A8D5FRB4_9BACT|nr:ATP-binding protein [Desulfomarina profundi]BCL60339.1 PAS domain-containing sensor histidine kinase [Desulfomarina profundi]